MTNQLILAPMSSILRFTVVMMIWLCLAAIQLGYAHLIAHRYFYDYAFQFIDLCCLANISIFILDGRYHGWYLHGKSLHQFADCCMEEMNENIEKEKRDLVQRRGLGQTLNETGIDKDTFEVFLNERFREYYDVNYGDVIGSVFDRHLQQRRAQQPHEFPESNERD